MCINYQKRCIDCSFMAYEVHSCTANGYYRRGCCSYAITTPSIRTLVCANCQHKREGDREKRRRWGAFGGTVDWNWAVEAMPKDMRA